MPIGISDRTVPGGKNRRLGARADAEFAEDAVDVVLDGPGTEGKEFGDLPAGSSREQGKHLTLTGCETEPFGRIRPLVNAAERNGPDRLAREFGDDLLGRRRPTGGACRLERCLVQPDLRRGKGALVPGLAEGWKDDA